MENRYVADEMSEVNKAYLLSKLFLDIKNISY